MAVSIPPVPINYQLTPAYLQPLRLPQPAAACSLNLVDVLVLRSRVKGARGRTLNWPFALRLWWRRRCGCCGFWFGTPLATGGWLIQTKHRAEESSATSELQQLVGLLAKRMDANHSSLAPPSQRSVTRNAAPSAPNKPCKHDAALLCWRSNDVGAALC